MATIEERRMKAAARRIKKGKKPFTGARPKALPKKGVVKVPSQVPEGRVQDYYDRGGDVGRLDWGAITDRIGEAMPTMPKKKKKSGGGDYGGGYI